MNQKTALYVALGLTTFILVAVSSIALAWPSLQQSSPSETLQPFLQEIPTVQVPLEQTSQTNVDVQSLKATIEARDAAYQAQIEQANQQLNDAYKRLQELESLNQALLQREQIYQQRLQESAKIIETLSAPATSSQATSAYYEGEEHSESHDDDDRYEKEYNDDYHEYGEHEDD